MSVLGLQLTCRNSLTLAQLYSPPPPGRIDEDSWMWHTIDVAHS